MMLAHKLRHRVRIERMTETQDPDTGAIRETWSTFADAVPADVQPMSGGEVLKAAAAQSTARFRFVIRHGLDVDPKMRIVHQGQTFNILDVIPDPTLRRHLTITTETGLRP